MNPLCRRPTWFPKDEFQPTTSADLTPHERAFKHLTALLEEACSPRQAVSLLSDESCLYAWETAIKTSIKPGRAVFSDSNIIFCVGHFRLHEAHVWP